MLAAAAFAAASITSQDKSPQAEQAQQAVTSSPAVPGSSAPGAQSSQSSPVDGVTQPRSTNPPPTTSQPPKLPLLQAVPPLASDGLFNILIKTQQGQISARVSSISVASNQPVDPPHNTDEEWSTAVWVEQSTYPGANSKGTSYIYGHACHHHVCPFTQLKAVQIDDLVQVTTSAATLTYRITQTGLSPKSANSLPSWASDSTVPNRIVLVTCQFEQGDTSTNNIVVVAQLVGPAP
jgi:LPXTG-site transpeptidase (sortase) family protein